MNQIKSLKLGQHKKGYLRKRLKESWQWYLLLLPGLIYLIIFEYGPMYGVQIAFKNYRASKGIWGSEWVGFKHFIHFFQYPNFWKMIKNTLSITLYSLLSAVIEKLRIEKSCDLIKNTDMKIADIAEMVGYTSDKSFRRAFKKIIGVSPVEYRG